MTVFVAHSKTASEASTLDEKAEIKRLFYETVDAIKKAVSARFEQDDLHILKAIERFILSAANKDYSVPEELVTDLVKLSDIIDLRELTSEAQELPVYLKLHNRKSAVPITRVTKVSTICDVMNSVSDSKDCLPQIHQLLKLYMSVPLGIRDSRAHVQCDASSEIVVAFVNVIKHAEQQNVLCHTQATN